MTRSQKLLLPLALVAGAALPALALADDDDLRTRGADDCVLVVDRETTVTPSLAEVATTNPLREAAVLTLAKSDAAAELRVKLRQDVARGGDDDGERGRGPGRRGGLRVVEVADDQYRVSVAKPEGGRVTFTSERVRPRPGKLTLRLRAVVADAEGEPARSYRATVQVRAYQEVCAEDEAATTTGATTTEAADAPAAATTTTDTTPDAARGVERAEDEREDERRGRGRGRDRDRD